MPVSKPQLRNLVLVALLLIPYVLYVGFVIQVNRGPVDYETFMAIGHRLRQGTDVYGENSYYPLPFVMIFAFFSWLPRPLSLALWLLLPVLSALAISGGRPYPLLFAPVFGHFVGGQTALFGMLGLWSYRRNLDTDNLLGGAGLAVTLLKPQLGLVPLAFAGAQWLSAFRTQKRVPRQAWAWGITMLVLYLPSFALVPDWPLRWLQAPRPLFERALSGFIPRTLLVVGLTSHELAYWLLWGSLSALLLLVGWLYSRRPLSLDLLVVWGFVASPLVHDYDLIQVVPLLQTPLLQWAAVALSVPGWWVILTAYRNDAAWYVFTFIALGLFNLLLQQRRKSSPPASSPPAPGPQSSAG